MKKLDSVILPDHFRINSFVKNVDGETNDVFYITGDFDGDSISAYIKVNKNPQLSLSNEEAVLTMLKDTSIPVPEVIWYGGKKNEVLIIEAIAGDMIWDYIDPKRKQYSNVIGLSYLRKYGKCLAQIHNIDVFWPTQKRNFLHGFIGEERIEDKRFKCLVTWLQANNMILENSVFVHSDFNTANVLLHNNSISGVIDWEFAGSGWKEYDIAWALRARLFFLNTEKERNSFLEGYQECSSYNEDALQWCEVLNYLHFAYWCRETEPHYTSFALDQAMAIMRST